MASARLRLVRAPESKNQARMRGASRQISKAMIYGLLVLILGSAILAGNCLGNPILFVPRDKAGSFYRLRGYAWGYECNDMGSYG